MISSTGSATTVHLPGTASGKGDARNLSRPVAPAVATARRGLAVADLLPQAGALGGFLSESGPPAAGSRDPLAALASWAREGPGRAGCARHGRTGGVGQGAPPTVLLLDWAPAEQAEAGTYAAHGIYWWSGGRLHSQVLYATDASAHGLGQTCALTDQAVLVPRPGGSAEFGVVYDGAAGTPGGCTGGPPGPSGGTATAG